jgi:hypothetical protein
MAEPKTVKTQQVRVSVRLIIPLMDMAALVDLRSALKLVADRYPAAILEIYVGEQLRLRG